jgi:hypothetical protein
MASLLAPEVRQRRGTVANADVLENVMDCEAKS